MVEQGDLEVSSSGDEFDFGQKAKHMLGHTGVCVLDSVLKDKHLIGECFSAALERLRIIQSRLDEISELNQVFAFKEVCQRAKGRYDIRLRMDEPPFTHPLLTTTTPWKPAVDATLGPGNQELFRGLVINTPGSSDQGWHSDGDHIFPESGFHLPPHCVTVFVALSDIIEELGPTEFLPGSHKLEKLFDYQQTLGHGSCGMPSTQVTCGAGSCITFDYRVIHRGRANTTSDTVRPVLYIVYGKTPTPTTTMRWLGWKGGARPLGLTCSRCTSAPHSISWLGLSTRERWR